MKVLLYKVDEGTRRAIILARPRTGTPPLQLVSLHPERFQEELSQAIKDVQGKELTQIPFPSA